MNLLEEDLTEEIVEDNSNKYEKMNERKFDGNDFGKDKETVRLFFFSLYLLYNRNIFLI
jgi:hypothetical protein